MSLQLTVESMKTDQELIQDLAGGFAIRIEDDEWSHGYYVEPPGKYDILSDQLLRLIGEGWLEGFANGGGYRLSDEGRKAFNRAMDELGDGKLIAPKSTALQQPTEASDGK